MTTADTFRNPQADALEAALPLGLASEEAGVAGAAAADAEPRADVHTAGAASSLLWVPVRRLGARHEHLVLQHLLALDAADRQLRFGHAVSDAMLQRYAMGLDYQRDGIFGVFNRRLRLIALAHLALSSSDQDGQTALGEFGVSVSASARRRGLGARLFEHCIVQARNLGVSQLVIHLAANNTAMLRIVQKVGAPLQHRGNEVEARLDLRDASWGSRIEALVEESAAKADFRIKLQLQRLDQMWQCSRSEDTTKLSDNTRTGDAGSGSRQ